MKPVVVELEIARPADVVWEYMENAEHNPEWLSNMRFARWTTSPPVAVGSRYDQMARFLGKEVRTSFEVTALRAGPLDHDLLAARFVVPDSDHAAVEPLGPHRTRVRETAEGDSSGFYRWLSR